LGSAALAFLATSSNLNTRERIASTTDRTKGKYSRSRPTMYRYSFAVAPMEYLADHLIRRMSLETDKTMKGGVD
jgi:hypothetical protein